MQNTYRLKMNPLFTSIIVIVIVIIIIKQALISATPFNNVAGVLYTVQFTETRHY